MKLLVASLFFLDILGADLLNQTINITSIPQPTGADQVYPINEESYPLYKKEGASIHITAAFVETEIVHLMKLRVRSAISVTAFVNRQ